MFLLSNSVISSLPSTFKKQCIWKQLFSYHKSFSEKYLLGEIELKFYLGDAQNEI